MTAPQVVPPSPPILVATLGPASFDRVTDLVRAGAHTFRLNGSHMSAGDVEQSLRRVRDLTDTPVVIDLQGAKMRLGSFSPRPLRASEPIVLAFDATEPSIPLPHAEIFRNARPGDTLSCDDDRVHLRIDSVDPNRLVATSLTDGTLKPRKGVNVVEHPVHLEDLTASDVAQIEVAKTFEGVSFACSFMRDGREAAWIRERAPGAKVVGKVERAEALEAIASIASCVDSLWICRGDLGAQVGLVAMARWVSAFRPETLPVPTLMAGQVLEHLTQHANPTRSEVCHLYDLLRRGYAGLVLSDETAIGHDPVRATTLASDLLRTLA
jgi:pyruvate kinase